VTDHHIRDSLAMTHNNVINAKSTLRTSRHRDIRAAKLPSSVLTATAPGHTRTTEHVRREATLAADVGNATTWRLAATPHRYHRTMTEIDGLSEEEESSKAAESI
jgi:hypothetical protein